MNADDRVSMAIVAVFTIIFVLAFVTALVTVG